MLKKLLALALALTLLGTTALAQAGGTVAARLETMVVEEFSSAEYPQLSRGSRGEDVKRLQTELIRLGFLDDRADGVYGKKTASAVHMFKEVNGIPDGNPHEATDCVCNASVWSALYSKDVKPYVAPTPAPTAAPVETANYLKTAHLTEAEINGGTGKVFGSAYDRRSICVVNFLDSLEGMPEGAWDVSEAQDGSVMAWVEPNGSMYDLYLAANGGVVANPDSAYLFANYTNVQKIYFNNSFITDGVFSMNSAFMGCSMLKSLDLSGLNTTGMLDMGLMFMDCEGLERLDLSGFDTSSVQNMRFMFSGCVNLQDLNLSSFNTSGVVDMCAMFNNCSALKHLSVNGFDTGNVRDFSYMFYNCAGLQELDVVRFNTASATDMRFMFAYCGSLMNLDVGGFRTGNVTNMQAMFNMCPNLRELEVTGFDTRNVTDMSFMFAGCSGLKTLNLKNFSTGNVVSMESMFNGCEAVDTLAVGGFDTAKVTNMSAMFCECRSLKPFVNVAGFETANVTTMSYMFYGCSSLEKLDVSGFRYDAVGDVSWMFAECTGLKSLVVGEDGFDNIQASTTNMFQSVPDGVVGKYVPDADIGIDEEDYEENGFAHTPYYFEPANPGYEGRWKAIEGFGFSLYLPLDASYSVSGDGNVSISFNGGSIVIYYDANANYDSARRLIEAEFPENLKYMRMGAMSVFQGENSASDMGCMLYTPLEGGAYVFAYLPVSNADFAASARLVLGSLTENSRLDAADEAVEAPALGFSEDAANYKGEWETMDGAGVKVFVPDMMRRDKKSSSDQLIQYTHGKGAICVEREGGEYAACANLWELYNLLDGTSCTLTNLNGIPVLMVSGSNYILAYFYNGSGELYSVYTFPDAGNGYTWDMAAQVIRSITRA